MDSRAELCCMGLLKEIEKGRYDFFPPQRLCPAMRELYRAMTVVADRIDGPKTREEFKTLRDGITFFFQEDDSYRFRFQCISKYLNPKGLLRRIFYLGRTYSFNK